MTTFSDRTAILLGEAGMEALRRARVSVFGLGGVGAACAMDLARSGVGFLHVVDFDLVEESNLNRLYFAYRDSIGRPKTEVFAEAALSINPNLRIEAERVFFSGLDAADAVARAHASDCGYYADCVDSLNPKAHLIAALRSSGLVFISSMGTAGRLDPTLLRVSGFGKVRGCPLARSLRGRLKKMGVDLDFPAVWSDETPVKPVPRPEVSPAPASGPASAPASGPATEADADTNAEAEPDTAAPRGRGRMMRGSSPFVPQTAGHFMASWIVRQILATGYLPVN